jgi:hypothetical protein
MKTHPGKLIPPEDVIEDQFEEYLEEKVREDVKERILREAGYEEQVTEALDEIERPSNAELIEGIKESFEDDPKLEWRAHLEKVASDNTESE